MLRRHIKEICVAYFPRQMNGIERGGKIAADIVCGLLLLAFALAFFGMVGGTVAFLILEGLLLAVDYVVPDADADAPSGAVVR
jgi:hypothetical protein